jgi:hypothetical protein
MGALMIGAAIAFAHNGIEHVMGAVKSASDASITVETVKHTEVTVMLDPSTTFTNKDAKASIKDLKIGERVVVNAKEGPDKKLHAVSVKWGATSDMKMPPGHKM